MGSGCASTGAVAGFGLPWVVGVGTGWLRPGGGGKGDEVALLPLGQAVDHRPDAQPHVACSARRGRGRGGQRGHLDRAAAAASALLPRGRLLLLVVVAPAPAGCVRQVVRPSAEQGTLCRPELPLPRHLRRRVQQRPGPIGVIHRPASKGLDPAAPLGGGQAYRAACLAVTTGRPPRKPPMSTRMTPEPGPAGARCTVPAPPSSMVLRVEGRRSRLCIWTLAALERKGKHEG